MSTLAVVSDAGLDHASKYKHIVQQTTNSKLTHHNNTWVWITPRLAALARSRAWRTSSGSSPRRTARMTRAVGGSQRGVLLNVKGGSALLCVLPLINVSSLRWRQHSWQDHSVWGEGTRVLICHLRTREEP